MKIQLQFYVFNPPLGGVENYFLNVGRELQKRGHDISVLCTRLNDNLPEREIVDGMEIIRHPIFLAPKYAPWRRSARWTNRADNSLGLIPLSAASAAAMPAA